MPPWKRDLSDGFKLPAKKLHSVPSPEKFIEAGNKGSSPKRNATAGKRCVVYLPPELLKALMHKCTDDERSVSNAVTEAIQLWIAR